MMRAMTALAVVGAFSAAVADGGEGALAAAACAKPKITSDVVYHEEKVTYDLDAARSSSGMTRGLYVHESRFAYETESEGACVRRLDLVIEVFPGIRLLSEYKKKRYKCARRYVLDHEREHGRVALESYKGFAGKLKKLAAALFARKESHEAALRAFADELDGGPVVKKFRKELDAKQDAFHAKEHSGALVSKKCRMKERR